MGREENSWSEGGDQPKLMHKGVHLTYFKQIWKNLFIAEMTVDILNISLLSLIVNFACYILLISKKYLQWIKICFDWFVLN